jgi:hypothetical protein
MTYVCQLKNPALWQGEYIEQVSGRYLDDPSNIKLLITFLSPRTFIKMVVLNSPLSVERMPTQYSESLVLPRCATLKVLTPLLEKKSRSTISAWLLLYEWLFSLMDISTMLSKYFDILGASPTFMAETTSSMDVANEKSAEANKMTNMVLK